MTRAGLTGGLASGKSFVGRQLEKLGCHLVRADDLGHQVLERGGEAFSAVVEHFGPEILDAEGNIDRKALASRAFGNPAELDFLNGAVHPAVIRMEEEFIRGVEEREPDAIAVVEAAILIETGSYRRFDRLILVVCTEEQQIARAMRRDGCTREEAEARLRRQMPLEVKRKYADYVIDTSGTKENTVEQTRRVFELLRSCGRN
jgi:dephospho-CoA kinase